MPKRKRFVEIFMMSPSMKITFVKMRQIMKQAYRKLIKKFVFIVTIQENMERCGIVIHPVWDTPEGYLSDISVRDQVCTRRQPRSQSRSTPTNLSMCRL
ncbi:hypothetical protein J6590_104662 [Homalodisca vitripennis]|nr:hypothetical protein J6590_080189 [Homalodisca vitripennis]KAG8289423.1 hypothetical protein J6590_104662 [Homalodisca vitripennis]